MCSDDVPIEDKKPADMWCVGCILYELCTRTNFCDQDLVLGKEVVKNPNYVREFLSGVPNHYSATLRNIMKRLLAPNPARRPRADELLKKNKVKQHRNTSPYKLAKEKSQLVIEDDPA
jgi:serine/threonine protein kinase